ncbi:MAG: hypothetical protein IJ754_09150 [Bacteroidaceae bacterium]|nr:hypothetical protein [Bacteroidaceae bacterium]
MTKEHYLSRPKTKPAETLKGKLNKWDNGYAEFIPMGTRESNRRMLKQLGSSSFYKTEGEKDSSYSLHLNVDARDCADPVAALFEQFRFLTDGERKSVPALPEGMEGRMLLDNGAGLQIWLDTAAGAVKILATLPCGPQIERMLLQAQAQMNVCIGRYRQEILQNKPQPSNNNKV